MIDPRLKKLAELLVNYSVDIQPDDWVLVTSHIIAEPLTNEVVRAVLEAGGNPMVIMNSDDLQETTFKYSREKQLEWYPPVLKTIYQEADAFIALRATENTRALSGIDPKKQQIHQLARRELTEIYMERSAEGDLNWTLTQYPCPAYAQEADMSLEEYADFVHSATFTDREDPVTEWERIHDEQQKIVDWLEGKSRLR